MTSENTDVRAYLRMLWRWKLLVLAFVIVIPTAVYLVASSQPKVYQSSVLMQVQPLTIDTSLFTPDAPPPAAPAEQALRSAARLITTTGVAQEAARELGESPTSARALLDDVTATADVQADFITIAARAGSPSRAANVANAFAEAVVTTRGNQAVGRLDATIAKVKNQLGQLERSDRDGRRQLSQQLQRLRALRAAQGSNASIIEPAVASSTPVAPRVTRTVVLAGIVALLLAFGAVVLAQGADQRIRDPLELEELIDRPMLGAIPRSAFNDERLSGVDEEAFQTLRASLTYFNVDRPVRSVIITSPRQGDGKTTVATNLARAMSRAGKDVLLVDADLRRPQVTSRLHIPGIVGLGAVLVNEIDLLDALVEPATDAEQGGRLRVLPAGPPPPNPSELLASQRMKQLLDELTDMSDLVIVDSTPLLTVSDSLPLIEMVSGVVVVARLNETTKDSVRRLERVVSTANGTLLGSVATGATTVGLYGRYGYGGYGYRDDGVDGVSDDEPRHGSRRRRFGRRSKRRGTPRPKRSLADAEARPVETTTAQGREGWFS